nr:endonuclease/exonuclease/phosphatase family protein [Kandeliimicrobium roseum]
MLRDILSGRDPQVRAVAGIVGRIAPDILVLQGIDWDLEGRTLSALADAFRAAGAEYPHRFAARPNSGLATGLDLDGDGRPGGPGDAQGYGRFPGQGGMAVLSRWPIVAEESREYTGTLWRDLAGALPPRLGAVPFPSAAAFAVQRLSSVAHWDVAVALPGGPVLHLLTWHASPPVFDGPEDRNGRRNHDEAAFWLRHLDGQGPDPPPEGPLVLIGDANLDTLDGDGRPEALRALLRHARLQDPVPRSEGGAEAAERQGGANAAHRGDPAADTADWDDDAAGPGNLRVDYILPSRDLAVRGAGVFWPPASRADPALFGADGNAASRHRMVWMDLEPLP